MSSESSNSVMFRTPRKRNKSQFRRIDLNRKVDKIKKKSLIQNPSLAPQLSEMSEEQKCDQPMLNKQKSSGDLSHLAKNISRQIQKL